MAEIRIWPSVKIQDSQITDLRIQLQDDGYYWWLYRYFQSARLPTWRHELIDLYGHSEISGYLLKLFHDELLEARFDAGHRSEQWSVRVGWQSEKVSESTERITTVSRAEMLRILEELISLTESAMSLNISILCEGD
jgi:hypothetical protein